MEHLKKELVFVLFLKFPSAALTLSLTWSFACWVMILQGEQFQGPFSSAQVSPGGTHILLLSSLRCNPQARSAT